MARKTRPPVAFPTGRRTGGTYKYGVLISDQLIIENTWPEGATGGVGRWATTFANRVMARAAAIAPVGNQLDHLHDIAFKGGYPFGGPGTYARSFALRKVGNGHVRRRVIGNYAPHAIFVETGRAPSGPAWELYSTWRAPGKLIRSQGTAGWTGYAVLSQALDEVSAVAMGPNIKATIRTANQALAEPGLDKQVEPDSWIVE